MTLDKVFLSLHVMGALMWIGSLFAVMSFLEAYAAEPEKAPRERLVKYLRQAAIVPEIASAITILFGAHWLFKFKLYQAHYMHPKLALVVVVLGLHGYLRRKVGQAKRGEEVKPPPVFLKPVLTLTALAIVLFVISKWPA